MMREKVNSSVSLYPGGKYSLTGVEGKEDRNISSFCGEEIFSRLSLSSLLLSSSRMTSRVEVLTI